MDAHFDRTIKAQAPGEEFVGNTDRLKVASLWISSEMYKFNKEEKRMNQNDPTVSGSKQKR